MPRQMGFNPVSLDELEMTGEPQAAGAAAILLISQVDRDDNGRTSHEDNYFALPRGCEATSLHIALDKRKQTI
jgi:hypothetical protein